MEKAKYISSRIYRSRIKMNRHIESKCRHFDAMPGIWLALIHRAMAYASVCLLMFSVAFRNNLRIALRVAGYIIFLNIKS